MISLEYNLSLLSNQFEEQKAFVSINRGKINYPYLKSYLFGYGLEKFYDEVACNISGPLFNQCPLMKGIRQWSIMDVSTWIATLSFVDEELPTLPTIIKEQWIDGDCFMSLDENEWISIGVSKKLYILLSSIRRGWSGEWGEQMTQSVVKARLTVNEDNASILKRNDIIYGQFTVLGTKESKVSGKASSTPLGFNNDNFLLKKRNYSFIQSLKQDGHDDSKIERVRSIINDKKDLFQIGRCDYVNDFVIHGCLHFQKLTGKLTSTVSRFACRIECSREPPFSSYLFASGFDENKELFISDGYIPLEGKKDGWPQNDTLSSFGLKLWNPLLESWCEISTQGRCFSFRGSRDKPGSLLPEPYTNQLYHGSVIDCHGVLLYFQRASTIKRRLQNDAKAFLKDLNALRPQCPVMSQTIQFTAMDAQDRATREFGRLLMNNMVYSATNMFTIPVTDYSDVEENSRTYVFPSCGHVHGYHQSLVGKSCPLCRAKSEFVPVALDFDSCLHKSKPTHVFNPCGHIASKKLCEKFSNIVTLVYNSHGDIIDQRARCPFCGAVLRNFGDNGGPYNRLILQSENGKNWESDSKSDESEDEEELAQSMNINSLILQFDIDNLPRSNSGNESVNAPKCLHLTVNP